MDDEELLDLKAVCAFEGGTKPLDPATVYRAVKRGDLPAPIKPTPGSSRWLKSELLAARARRIAERDADADVPPEAA